MEIPQIQTQAQEEWIQIPWRGFQEPEVRSWRNIDFVIYTWGSCRKSRVEVVYPRRADLVALSDEYGEYTVDLGFAVVEIVNSDSNKNLHRYITFERVDQDTVVYVYHSPSCNEGRRSRRAYLLKPDGSASEVPVEVKIAEAEEGVKRKRYRVYYAGYSGVELELERELVSEEVIVERLTVNVKRAGSRVVVHGDTYHVRDVLKSHGFRWDPREKVWFREPADADAIANAIRALGVNMVVE